jgi:putative transcriptional regulator
MVARAVKPTRGPVTNIRAAPASHPSGVIQVTRAIAQAALRDTDWSALDAMTDTHITRQVKSNPDAAPLLTEAETFAGLVRATRRRTGLPQAVFAEVYRIPVGTLRDWEQGRRVPDKPGLALLHAIQTDPATMRRLLAG